MLWPGLRIFVGTMVFISIFHPCPCLLLPKYDLRFMVYATSATNTARVCTAKRQSGSGTAETKNTPPQTLQPGRESSKSCHNKHATTETSAGETLQEENLQIKTGAIKKISSCRNIAGHLPA